MQKSILTNIIIIIILLNYVSAISQIKIGDNPTKINSSSLLELESKTQGLLLPRMNTVEMVEMKEVPDGMILYNTDSASVLMRTEGKWQKLKLEVENKTQGLLLPRMNTFDIEKMKDVSDGMILYNTDSATVLIRSGGLWQKLQFQTEPTVESKPFEDELGYVLVHKFCQIGDGTFYNPWRSTDGSAGIKEALKQLTPTKRVLFFRSGYFATSDNLVIDFEKELPNLDDPLWRVAFSGYGIEFRGHNAAIYVNGGAPLNNNLPGLQFIWKNAHAFYWKFTGLQFYGVVDNALVQWGNSYDFPLNGFEFDIVANNGYVFPDYLNAESPSSAIKICWPLESRLHLVAVSASGSGAILETASFCTISGAFSNTLIPGTNTIYNNSYGLNLINAQSNTFTSMDLEVAFNGIKFDSWSIQNTFSAIFVSNCDSLGATFDNSKQATNGKNLVLSIRSGPTIQEPSVAKVQKLFSTGSDSTKVQILNYFDFPR